MPVSPHIEFAVTPVKQDFASEPHTGLLVVKTSEYPHTSQITLSRHVSAKHCM